ncbi:cyclic nucleotide-binding domain-containing protein [Roseivirga echinicomitans]|uniref:Cyclic nucleotide-binding domain-containing protein n=1 Tax=Roseivirga echinicomitans TaxID=296218 RepID=A0A150XUQ3_9BACT|nr:cyclic nucleotide-binding domain-containing protein [Roseivirga echinicomitans]KYG82479.1 hypothetical protein AWN68_14590 [Roseivirga echinicomitans]
MKLSWPKNQRSKGFSIEENPYLNIPSKSFKVFRKNGGKLYSEGEKLDHFYRLIEGEVLLTKKDQLGRNILLLKVNQEDLLGFQAIQNSNVSTHTAHIHKPSRFMKIPLSLVTALPNFHDKLIQQLVAHLDQIEKVTLSI